MALRISAKRAAATLKVRNGSIADYILSKRHVSQATATVTNLFEEGKSDIYVRSSACLRANN